MSTLRRSPALWLAAYGLTLLGGGIMAAVLPLLVLQRTGDVLAAGVLATVTTTASALTGLVSGLVVDRVDRRLVTVVAGVLGAAVVAALPVVDPLWGLGMTAFLVLGVLGAVVRVPAMTAQEVLLPALVRLDPRPGRLDRLIALRENLANVLLLAGPAIGGLLVALAGPVAFFGLLAANLAYSLVGHRHRHSIPAVIAVGVIALVGGQLVLDRVLGFGTELPVVIEFLGGVLFIILVLTGRAR